jgi:glycosyltransferase involved in cell wall biosynthesis
MDPQIQVYIPVFNGMPYIRRAIKSALRQKDVALEVIVSDNGSDDGTHEFVRQMAASDDRIKLYRNEKNIGLFGNFNLVRKYVTADFYMLLCADDMFLDNTAMRRALKIMHSDPQIVSVYSNMQYINRNDGVILNRYLNDEGLIDVEQTIRKSIISNRNLFGIPLLHRSSEALQVEYPEIYKYSADLLHSALVAKRGKVCHLTQYCLGNRYTGANATMSLYSDAATEFGSIAKRLSVALNPFERLLFAFNAAKVHVQKRLFLAYASRL